LAWVAALKNVPKEDALKIAGWINSLAGGGKGKGKGGKGKGGNGKGKHA
jgi:hypothetical protein